MCARAYVRVRLHTHIHLYTAHILHTHTPHKEHRASQRTVASSPDHYLSWVLTRRIYYLQSRGFVNFPDPGSFTSLLQPYLPGAEWEIAWAWIIRYKDYVLGMR